MTDKHELTLNPWCLGILWERMERLIVEMDWVRQDRDTDHIRKVRVFSRRLRTALSLMKGNCLLPDYRGVRKRLRRVSRALGAVRDLDVQIQYLRSFIKERGDRAVKPGLSRLLLRIGQERSRHEESVRRLMGRPDVMSELFVFLENLQKMQIRCEMEGIEPDFVDLRRIAFEKINLQRIKLVSYAPFLKDPSFFLQQHEMRIEVKRLRYIMEIFSGVYEGTLDEYIVPLKILQSHLGELHDTDVWLQMLPVFIEKEKERTVCYFGNDRNFSRLLPGFLYLLEQKRVYREVIYENSLKYWDQLEQEALWRNLREHLSTWNSRDRSAASQDSGIADRDLLVLVDGIE